MSAWIYIAAGVGAFVVFVLMFVLMTLVDDWERVNGEVNNGEVNNGEGRGG